MKHLLLLAPLALGGVVLTACQSNDAMVSDVNADTRIVVLDIDGMT